MICLIEITKQDRLAFKILAGIATTILNARKEMSYSDCIKNGMNNNTLMGVIDFGISEGVFMPGYKLKNYLTNTKDFFDNPPPQDILIAIFKELQKYPQGSIKKYG
jgi:hypothetical protein